MATDIANFEKWLRNQLVGIAEVAAAVGTRVYNSSAMQGAQFPYLVYKTIPLKDAFGQARTSIQTRILCDIQIYSRLPLTEEVDEAVEAIKEHFRTVRPNSFQTTSISIRHEMPISREIPGAQASEKIISQGGSYRAWLSKI